MFTNNQIGITWIFTDLTYTYTMSIFFSNLRPRCWDFEKEKRAQTRHMDTLPNKMRLVIGTWSAGYSWNVRTHQLWFNNLKTKWFKNIFIEQIYKWNNNGQKFRNWDHPLACFLDQNPSTDSSYCKLLLKKSNSIML